MYSKKNSFEKIYAENYRIVFSFLHKMSQDHEIARELTKSTFLKAYKDFYKFNGSYSFKTWILAYAAEQFLKYIEKTDGSIDIVLYVADPEADLSEDPVKVLKKTMELESVTELLSGFEHMEIMIYLLRLYGDVSYEGLAALFEISPNSVKMIYVRTRELLKEGIFNEGL